MSAAAADPGRLRRRLLVFLGGAILWIFLACYPNPAVFVRNLARYDELPINPGLEEQMGWELPREPVTIELFVDSLLVPTADWKLYRVPWYVPRAAEAVAALHGDCEAKAIVLASLLEGKGLPYELRASLTHIWVDYPGRPARPGEQREVAYLEGEPGSLRVHWPSRLEIGNIVRAQWQQLWGEMPLARKAVLLVGLVWAALASVLLKGTVAEGQFVSRWRPPLIALLARAAWLAVSLFIATALVPHLRPGGGPVRWTVFDLREVLALSVLAGGFLAWVTVFRPQLAASAEAEQPEGSARLRTESRFGLWRRRADFDGSQLSHFELRSSPGGLRPWGVSAGLRSGRLVPLLRYTREEKARRALRDLGRALAKPLLVRARRDAYRTMPDEIGLNLKQRAGQRPGRTARDRPQNCPLIARQEDGIWWLGYPRPEEDAVRMLLSLAGACVGVAVICTGLLLRFPYLAGTWAAWLAGAALLGMTVYAAIVLRQDVLAWLAGARIEVSEGELRVRRPEGKLEAVRVEDVLSVELSWRADAPTIAVVTPDRVLHFRLACGRKHLRWARDAVEQAVIEGYLAAEQSGAAPSPAT